MQLLALVTYVLLALAVVVPRSVVVASAVDGTTIVSSEEAHRALYVAISVLRFRDHGAASTGLADIRKGYKTWLGIAKELNQDAVMSGREMDSRDMGLTTYDQLEPEVALLAFDVREPVAKSASDIVGPICTKRGCTLFSVFSRYRRTFFSNAWFEFERWCLDNNEPFMNTLDHLSKQEAAQSLAFVVWPHEHISIKKLKLAQLKADMVKIGTLDPTTVMPERPAKTNPRAFKAMMDEREELLARVPKAVFDEHPEIYAMSMDQIVDAGWVPGAGPAPVVAADAGAATTDAKQRSVSATLAVEANWTRRRRRRVRRQAMRRCCPWSLPWARATVSLRVVLSPPATADILYPQTSACCRFAPPLFFFGFLIWMCAIVSLSPLIPFDSKKPDSR